MAMERGRPRGFDTDEALDKALTVFWRNGFQGASLSELTDVTGLSKPSLYAAFGDKEALYLKSLDRYVSQQLAKKIEALEDEQDGYRAMETFLRSLAAMFTDPAMPGGCFIINGIADRHGPGTPHAVDIALEKMLQASEATLRSRLVRAQRDGHLSKSSDPSALAGFFYALVAGLAVKAKAGAKRASLYAIIDAGMGAWQR